MLNVFGHPSTLSPGRRLGCLRAPGQETAVSDVYEPSDAALRKALGAGQEGRHGILSWFLNGNGMGCCGGLWSIQGLRPRLQGGLATQQRSCSEIVMDAADLRTARRPI